MLQPIGWLGRAKQGLAIPWVRTVFILWIVQLIGEIAFGFGLPFTPLFVQELGVSDPKVAGLWAGAMSAGFAVCMGIMSPVWGVVADRYGRRLMIQRVLFGMVFALGAIAFVQNPEQLFVLRLLQGILSGLGPAIATVVSLNVPRERLGAVLGMFQTAFFVGNTVGPLLGGIMGDQIGFRGVFVVTGVAFALAGLLVTFFIAEPAREPVVKTKEVTENTNQGWRQFLLRPEILVVLWVTILLRFANFAPNPVLPLYIQDLSHDPSRLATISGLLIAATGIASTISALVVGGLADRFGRRNVLLASLLVATLVCPPQAFVTNVWQLLVLRVLTGLALGGMTPALQAIITELTPPERRGMAFGVLATASSVGLAIGPLSGSLIAAQFGISAIFLAMIPFFLIGIWSMNWIPKKIRPLALAEPTCKGPCDDQNCAPSRSQSAP